MKSFIIRASGKASGPIWRDAKVGDDGESTEHGATREGRLLFVDFLVSIFNPVFCSVLRNGATAEESRADPLLQRLRGGHHRAAQASSPLPGKKRPLPGCKKTSAKKREKRKVRSQVNFQHSTFDLLPFDSLSLTLCLMHHHLTDLSRLIVR